MPLDVITCIHLIGFTLSTMALKASALCTRRNLLVSAVRGNNAEAISSVSYNPHVVQFKINCRAINTLACSTDLGTWENIFCTAVHAARATWDLRLFMCLATIRANGCKEPGRNSFP